MTDDLDNDLSCNCRSFHRRGIGVGVVIKDFTACKAPLMICALGDIHGGSATYKLFDKTLEEVVKKNCRVLFTGDLIDNRINQSKSFTHGSESPHLELDMLSKIFEKYSSYIDGIVGGNHDVRTFRYAGEDPIRRLCLQYKIAYHPDALVIIYKVGETSNKKIVKDRGGRHDKGPVIYKIFMSHSNRSGRKEGGKLQKVVDFKNITNADIFLSGHSHDLTSHKGGFIDISQKGLLKMKEQMFVNCGAFQPYTGYIVNHNFAPLPNGYALLELNNTESDVKVLI
jgi:predicted phosphodiesterase